MAKSQSNPDLLQASTELGRAANSVLILWLVPLILVWMTNILPQLFRVETVGPLGIALDAETEDLKALLRSYGRSDVISDPEIVKDATGVASELRNRAIGAIVNQPIKLPLGIEFNCRATFVPAFWCVSLLSLLAYLVNARSRCHRLVAREIRRRGHRHLDADESVVHAMPWWMLPLPRRDGANVTASRFRRSLRWTLQGSAGMFVRRGASVLVAAAFTLALIVSWKSAVLVDGEERGHGNPQFDTPIALGATLHDIEWFAMREATVALAVVGAILAIYWFRPTAVPDDEYPPVVSSGRRQLLAGIGASAVAALVPGRNLVSSLWPTARVRTSPRFISRATKETRRAQKRQGESTRIEAAVVDQMSGDDRNAVNAINTLLKAIEQDRKNVRLYDYAAALSVEHGLPDMLARVTAVAVATTELPSANHRDHQDSKPGIQPVSASSEPALAGQIFAVSERPKIRAVVVPPTIIRAILRGTPIRPSEDAVGARRCKNGAWERRIRHHAHQSAKELLSARLNRWRDPAGSWSKLWKRGGTRQARGWRLPGKGVGTAVCS